MVKISRDQADSILKPYYDDFVGIMQQAHKEWLELAALKPVLSPRTRVNAINDLIRAGVRRVFSSNPDTRIIAMRGLFFLKVGQIAGRFKRLRNSRPSNIPTYQSGQLEMQQLSLGRDFERPLIVNIGYTPNKAWDQIKYEISCVRGRDVLWSISLSGGLEIESPIEIPVSDIPPQAPKKRVFKKRQNE
ncbi:hypothetical protein [Zoogloea sp.]|uniref:hypothetical protein n=1 Tax=Zoogloea sp. TaxID=49181 RepID=UPI0014169869|nr:MAG: hypothetical protein F9K15_12800 [Zoogloea sp.]